MKKLSFIFLLILMFFSKMYSIQVLPGAGPYYVGDLVQFRASNSCFGLYPGTLQLGDGYSITNVNDSIWRAYRYKDAGTYMLVLQSGMCGTETMSITIQENRYIVVSPEEPMPGQEITFTAYNFNTPDDIRWDMDDGTILRTQGRRRLTGGSVVTHTYTSPGNYTVKAYDWNGSSSFVPVQLTVNVVVPARSIAHDPDIPRAHQRVNLEAMFFTTSSIEWNFGDGAPVTVAGKNVIHSFTNPGTYTVSARDVGITHPPVTKIINVDQDIRTIRVTPTEVKKDEEVLIQGFDFYADFILWNFGDGSAPELGLSEIRHTYTRSGTFTISAYDYNGESTVPVQTEIRVLGIDDQVILEIAEIKLDNGKYYKIVSKNSKAIHALYTSKMRGTGIVSGYWIVDGHPFEFFNEVAYQGELKVIRTRQIPGLPTIEPGLHTVTLRLTRPQVQVTFPELKYFVLPYEVFVETVSPPDGFVAKEKEIPEFSWKEPRGGVKYQIAFSNYLYPFLYNTSNVRWIDLRTTLKYVPTPSLWKSIKRNRWTYWKVRSLDTMDNIVAESDIMDLKVIVGTAEVTINKVTDLDGKEIKVSKNIINSEAGDLLIHGCMDYEGESKYLLLRVFADDELVDQLLFRDLKKKDRRYFETSIPNKKKLTKVIFQVLKTSSPAVIVGIKGITLKK